MSTTVTRPTAAARNGDTPTIELRGVRKVFGDFVAVDSISLAVARGEFLTLLGPSGCGKTTTLRMIGGFEFPTAGVIAINGQPMGNLPPYKRPVNTVFQNYALFPHMTVAQNVAYGLEMSGVGKSDRDRRAREALEMVRLPNVEKRKPGELSGGQQQRVALARALVNRPEVLLLDEPLGALDLKLRKAMQLELKQLNRETGATFVYVTHDQEEALTMSDRVAVMNNGRVLQLDAPRAIYEQPTSRFVADFIGQTNFLDGEIVGVSGETGELRLPGGRVVRGRLTDFSPRSGAASLAIRPEKVSFLAEASEADRAGGNRLSGAIAEVIYLGTSTRFNVDLGGGASLAVLRQNRETEDRDYHRGEPVDLVFPVAAAVLLGDGAPAGKG